MCTRAMSVVTGAVVAAVWVIALAGCVSSYSAGKPVVSHDADAHEDIVTMFEELIRLREAVVANMERFLEEGRLSLAEWADAKIELSEARMGLARAQDRHDLVIQELQKMVATCEEWQKLVKRRADVGRASEVDLLKTQIATLEAQIRLAMAADERE